MTYSDILRPQHKLAYLYDAGVIVLGAVLVALMSRISIYTPISPVPITGQTFAVLLVAALLGSQRGAASMLTYITAGLMGLPVFASGVAGPAVLAGPTVGYLVGFVFAAALVGYLAEHNWDQSILKTVAAMVFGNIVIYIFGALWLLTLLEPAQVIAVGVAPFLVGDAIKIALAAVLLPSGWQVLRWLNPNQFSSVESTP